jgi:ATP-dependent protease ClpP protease subunit
MTAEQFRPRPKKAPRRVDEDYDEGSKREPFTVMAQAVNTAYQVRIDQDFESVGQFSEVVMALEQARPGDVMEIKLSTNGGALHACLPLMNAMASTHAQVNVHAESDVASAGTFLLMLADDVYINPYVTVMFHQVSYGASGPGNQVEDRVTHIQRSSKRLITDMYKDFFTEEEIAQMLSGKEFWLTKEQFDERYDRREKLRGARVKAAMAAQKATGPKPVKKKKPTVAS